MNKDVLSITEQYSKMEEGLLNRLGARVAGALSSGPKGGYTAGKANYYKTVANQKIAKFARDLSNDLRKLGIPVDVAKTADLMAGAFNQTIDTIVNNAIKGTP